MGARTLVLLAAAGLGLVGGADLQETRTASLGPSGRDRPAMVLRSARRPTGGPIRVPLAGAADPVPPEAPEAPCDPPASRAPAVISGTVVDETGEGVEGLELVGGRFRRGRYGRGFTWRGVTGARGVFEVEVEDELPPPQRREFLLSMPWPCGFLDHGLPASPGQWEALEAGGSLRDLRFVVRRAAVVTGRVLRSDGMPVPGADVQLIPSIDSEEGGVVVEADRDGRFLLRALDPREDYSLEASLGPFTSDRIDLRGLLAAGETREQELLLDGLDLGWFAAKGETVFAGIVVDEGGAPVAGARIGGNWVRTLNGGARDPVSQADGRFEGRLCDIPGPSRGDAPWDDELCEVRKEGFGSRTVRATAVEEDILATRGRLEGIRVVLRRGAAVAGRVLTPEGAPVPGARIVVTDLPGFDDTSAAGWERFHAGEDGSYRIPDLDEDDGRNLLVQAEGRLPAGLPLRGRLAAGEERTLDVVLDGVAEE